MLIRFKDQHDVWRVQQWSVVGGHWLQHHLPAATSADDGYVRKDCLVVGVMGHL